MARELKASHLDKYASKEYRAESAEELRDRQIQEAKAEIAALQQKVADLLKAVAEAEGETSEDIETRELPKAVAIPDRWFTEDIGARNTLRELQDEEKEHETKKLRPEHYKGRLEQLEKGGWQFYENIKNDFLAIAKGEIDDRLQKIWDEHYPKWTQQDFKDLLQSAGVMPKETIQTNDFTVLSALFYGQLEIDLQRNFLSEPSEKNLQYIVKEFLLAQGIAEDALEDLSFDTEMKIITGAEYNNDYTSNLSLLGHVVARIKVDKEKEDVDVTMFNKGIEAGLEDLLDKYLVK